MVKSSKRISDIQIFYPVFFTSIWLWLYAASGFILKAAHRFDIGFDWFNRTFDIEKKPLQSIGLVAGAIVAVGYWSAVVVSRGGEVGLGRRPKATLSYNRLNTMAMKRPKLFLDTNVCEHLLNPPFL